MFTMLGMVGCLLFAAPTHAEQTHTIQPGDGLISIANDYQIDLDTLIAANAFIDDADSIQAGETITIPDEDGAPFTVTAYTAGEESTGKQPGDPGYGETASGTEVQEGHTIACPPSLSFGTTVHIPELDETYVCEDRGGAITNGHMDVYMNDLDDALEFGVQDLQVKIWN